MTQVAVFGSGFGLYGYLPALVADGHIVVLDERYRERLIGRSDVCDLVDRVVWVAGEAAQLAQAGAVVVARRPIDQVALAEKVMTYDGIRRVFLEKPLAQNPAASLQLLDHLGGSKRILRTGHNFHETDWARRLAEIMDETPDRVITIHWKFQAHHFAHEVDTWKRHHAEGGGAIRFYGIHLIHLAATLGFTDILESTAWENTSGEIEAWSATLGAASKASLKLLVDSNSPETRFDVWANAPRPLVVELGDPYNGGPIIAGYDRRTSILQKILRDFLETDQPVLERDRLCLELWRKIESTTYHAARQGYSR